MTATMQDLFIRCRRDPQWESEVISRRPLRGPQAEIIRRAEKFVAAHEGGVMTIQCPRQVGKNDMAAVLQRRHLWRNRYSPDMAKWIRTAPTHKPQIVNSKRRLEELMGLDRNVIKHPLFLGARMHKSEGYIWRVGNATVEFLSSGKTANVVGATASTCLDMDEAHKVQKEKFDEDFAPFTANTNAATLLWGVAANGLDTIEWYRQANREAGREDLNLRYPCDIWMELHAPYAAHVESRIAKLGETHPIIRTQYKLEPVSAEGRFLSDKQAKSLFSGDHERVRRPVPGRRYEIMIDIAAGNEEYDPDKFNEDDEDTDTDSTVAWVYEVTPLVCSNNLFPIIRIVDVMKTTGIPLPVQQPELEQFIEHWRPDKLTIDAVGVGRQIAEALELKYGKHMVNAYTASDVSVSQDCFDLLARINFNSVLMFRDDGSPEWAECKRQVEWTRYASHKGQMKLLKPKAEQHIDMVKGLTYIHQNGPVAGVEELYAIEGEYV